MQDPSCIHSTLAHLLRADFGVENSALVLGASACTLASQPSDGYLFFGDPYLAVREALRRSGFRIVRIPLVGEVPFAAWAELLAAGKQLAVTVDAYYLPYYTKRFHREHFTHTVLVRDVGVDSVWILDAAEESAFDGPLRLDDMVRALIQDPCYQAWLPVERLDDEPTDPRQRVGEYLADLRGGRSWLGGVEMIDVLLSSLSEHLELITGSFALQGEDDERFNRARCVWMGIWFYHNILRWFGAHLKALTAEHDLDLGPALPGVLNRAARDLLVASMLFGYSAERESAPSERIAVCLRGARQALESAGTSLEQWAGDFTPVGIR